MLEDGVKQEITIIKRKKRKDDCHHGGVWKIAYADFMTAMMAFFLVMWLINASNEATRAQVASYFNPVKLVDSSTQPRGLNDKEGVNKSTEHSKDKKSVEGSKDEVKPKKEEHTEKSDTTTNSENEAELLRSPQKVLNKIAGGPSAKKANNENVEKITTKTGAVNLRKFKDPFAPKNWKVLKVELMKDNKKKLPKPPSQKNLKIIKTTSQMTAGGARKKSPIKKTQQQVTMRKGIGSKLKDKSIPKPAIQSAKFAVITKAKSESEKKKQSRFSELRSEILKATNKIKSTQRPQANIKITKQGLLLSVSDDVKFEMFKVASARPVKELVIFMEKIAQVLKKQPGKIVVRGHTDGRPFHSKDYDNWRLSSARAQMAYHMLIRGGVKEDRFVRIEGHSDRHLKIPEKPYDARNRRIEILLLDKSE